ncbi:MAG: amidohydrolase family protein, partial [Hyphomicrobiales bacterium]|nr:amidohydrolase family protein [Hyphomicrobiales bacterium]
MPTPEPILFRNLSLLDPRWNEPRGGYEVLVEGGLIKEVSDKAIKANSARKIDCGTRVLMPGLIDCHVHVYLSEVNLRLLESIPVSLLAARSAPL